MTSTKQVKDIPAKKANDKPAETQAAAKTATPEAKRGPAKQCRIDDVSASVFVRDRNGRTWYSVSFTRSYKDRDGTWKYTKNFDVEDLGKVVTVAQQAAEWIHGQQYAEPEKTLAA